ncbi:bifunctional riboflavin kinase/FAD synthetase [Desulfitibacter alkalitolerans]|uniref:bifunctional riboflavin kinase/FAD synthetase n=1 Tax=Desulfitibacter alkalitolerans TaxID=264641 RepID=UPI000485F814|nr:bifunctional riboflavin kinase/FAD synthetase [Desulfitibacter alkalitolerans]
MQVYRSLSKELLKLNGSYVSLGNFDGVHLGHRMLIQKCVSEAVSNKRPAVVYTFSPHPEQMLFPDSFNGYITSPRVKEQLLKECGVEVLINHPFTEEFSQRSPEEFVKDYLVYYLNPRKIFVGYNFSFGKGGRGNPHVLEELGERYGFKVHREPPVRYDNIPISSSRIRKLLEKGDIISAKSMLGYWPIIEGKVVAGDKIGRKIGFPTANLLVEADTILPMKGVYATYTKINGHEYKSVTNIGCKPTFDGKILKIETHILDFSECIYDNILQLAFIQRIRDEKKFSSIEELKQQLSLDVTKAKTILLHGN